MKHVIKSDSAGLSIQVSEFAGKEEGLLAAFQQCREGRCSCPTNEFSKLDSLEIENAAGRISLRLRARKGQQFDTAEIRKCLDHADEQADPAA